MSEPTIAFRGAPARAAVDTAAEREARAFAQGSDGQDTPGYSEEAFRYLLAIEQKRAVRANRPFYLLLIRLGAASNGPVSTETDVEVAERLFAALAQTLRETDFFGWYREGRTIGAVLAQFNDVADQQFPATASQRVREQVLAAVGAKAAQGVRMRIFQLPGMHRRA